jgi:type IV secretion system protein TrbL
MSPPNAGILDTVLNTFRTEIDSGFGVLQGPVSGTLGTLIVISLVIMALFWAVDDAGALWAPLFRKILVVGWWSYLILNWQSLALAIYTAFGALGAQVGGVGGLAGFLNYPSAVVHLGIVNAEILLDLAAYYAGQTNPWGTPPIANTGLDLMAAFKVFLGSLVNIIEALGCALLIFIAYFWLALEIVVTTIEFHIVILIGYCALPFGVLERTSAHAERVLAYIISAGFKVMALGVVIGLGQNFLTNYQLAYTPGVLPGIDQMAGLALGILVVLMLAISAPKYAQAIIMGGTSTSIGGLAAASGVAIGAGLAVTGGVRTAIGAASSVAGAIGGGASRAAAAARGSRGGGANSASSTEASATRTDRPSSAQSSAPASAPSVADLAASVRRQSPKQRGLSAASSLAASVQTAAADSRPPTSPSPDPSTRDD